VTALRAEWTKLRTSPGTLGLLLVLVATTVAVSAAAAAAITCRGDCGIDPARVSLTGVRLGQAVVAILAVLMIGTEYGTGMIRTTLTAVPRRWTVLLAKSVVLVAVVAVAATVAVLGSLLVGRELLPAGQTFSWTAAPVLRATIGSVVYLVLVAVLGLGVATAVRNAAAAIGLVLGLLYLFPILALSVSDPTWIRRLEKVGPMTAGLGVQATKGLEDLAIGPWRGIGVLGAWALAALVTGGVLLRRRDA
jgi:ABC-2 type transport system permease protein